MRLTTIARPAVVLAAVAACAVPAATATAGTTDRDHDHMPDRWERSHHLNTHRNDAARDADRDGLRNLAEYRAGTDPRDRDSDDDGLSDKAEHAGTVASFANGTLTLTLFDGTTLTGTVDGRTEIECDDAAAPTAPAPATGTSTAALRHDGADDRDDDRGDDDRRGRDGDEAEDENEDEDGGCTTAALVPGATVDEAVVAVTAAGRAFRKIELG